MTVRYANEKQQGAVLLERLSKQPQHLRIVLLGARVCLSPRGGEYGVNVANGSGTAINAAKGSV